MLWLEAEEARHVPLFCDLVVKALLKVVDYLDSGAATQGLKRRTTQHEGVVTFVATCRQSRIAQGSTSARGASVAPVFA